MTQNPGHGPGNSAGEPDDAHRDEPPAYAPAEPGAQRNGSFPASEGGSFRANDGGAFRAYGSFPGGAVQPGAANPSDRPQGPSPQPEPPHASEQAGPPRLPQRQPGASRGPVEPRAFDPGPTAGGPAEHGSRAYSESGYPDDRYAPGGHAARPAYERDPYQAPGYQDRYANEPQADQRYTPGYADPGYSDPGYPEYEQAGEGYRGRGQVREPSYQDPRYDGSYAPPAQPGAGYGGESYAQQPGYAYPGYNAGYEDRDFGYNQGYQAGFTATLQLDDGSGRTYQLREGSNVIGRGQDAHFRLPDTGVSRRHFEIRWDGQFAMLGDLGSTNGTSVNGSTVQDWQLADGDVVRAGHSDLIVRIV